MEPVQTPFSSICIWLRISLSIPTEISLLIDGRTNGVGKQPKMLPLCAKRGWGILNPSHIPICIFSALDTRHVCDNTELTYANIMLDIHSCASASVSHRRYIPSFRSTSIFSQLFLLYTFLVAACFYAFSVFFLIARLTSWQWWRQQPRQWMQNDNDNEPSFMCDEHFSLSLSFSCDTAVTSMHAYEQLR